MRKAWEDLSPGYRARLVRAGITAEAHASGAGLHKARGHKTAAYEKQQRDWRKEVKEYARRQARLYGPNTGQTEADYERELLAIAKQVRQRRARDLQLSAEALYDGGDLDAARRTFWYAVDVYNRTPHWFFFYHGAFG